jgi:aminomethyltransferase
LESGLAWTVAFEPAERNFIGRAALEKARREGGAELIGLLLEDRGVLRSHQKVVSAADPTGQSGEVTSGTFSPTLNRSIALARVPKNFDKTVQVEIRGKLHAAKVVKPPFVRHGKAMIDL